MINVAIHERFVSLLPELNAATGYGAATAIIRKHLDKNFGKPVDVEKTYKVKVRCSKIDYHTYEISAFSEDEASVIAQDKAADEDSYDDVETWEIGETKP